MKKIAAALILIVILCAALMPSALAAAAPAAPTAPDLKIFEVTDANGSPMPTPTVWATGNTVKPESYLDTIFYFTPTGNVAIVRIISIDIATSTDLTIFPFEVAKSNYYVPSAELVAGAHPGIYGYHFQMRCRGDAAQGYYQIPFKVEYETPTGVEIATVPVDVLVKAEEVVDDGGGANIPKVIISNFSTNPGTVVAGDVFTLTVTFRNTSSTVAPTNIKAQLAAGDGIFVPVSGSSTLFMDSIAPGGTRTLSIELKAKSDAAPGSYAATFALNYEVAGVKDPIADSEVISIPVIQTPRVQISAMQIYPTEVYVGNEINVMCNINNTGKSKLYNVNINFSDVNGVVNSNEQFVGNVEPGTTGAVDIYLSTAMPGEAQVKMLVTYEDENGKQFTHEETATIFVMERAAAQPLPGIDEPVNGGEGSSGKLAGFSLWWLLLIPLVAGVIVMIILLARRKRKSNSKFRVNGDRNRNGAAERDYLKQKAAEDAAPPESATAESAPPAGEDTPQ